MTETSETSDDRIKQSIKPDEQKLLDELRELQRLGREIKKGHQDTLETRFGG